MAEEQNNQGELVPKADLDALRSKLDRQIADARKERDEALAQLRGNQAIVSTDFDIELPKKDDEIGLSDEAKLKIELALKKGKEHEKNLATAINFALDNKAEALSWQIAVENKAIDDRDEIKSRLLREGNFSIANMETVAKTINLEYKEQALEASKNKTNTNEDGDSNNETANPGRQFAGSGGKGTSSGNLAVIKEIDEVDPTDPDAAKKMEALYKKLKLG